MPKRKFVESKEERWRRKMKKYEDRLQRKTTRVIYSSDDENLQDEPIHNELVESEREPSPIPILPILPIPKATGVAITEPEREQDLEPMAEAERIVDEGSGESAHIDPELLQALGDFIPESSEWGQDINDNLAKRWDPILKSGLAKEIKDEILKKYLPPRNCPLAKPPILNAELAAALTESAKNRDQRIFKKQNQFGGILAILGRLASGLLCNSIETVEALRLLSDASRLLADSHFTETETRRALIIPLLEKSFIDPFKDRKRDSYLFGENLSEFIKSSRGIKKTGELIQATVANLNWKGPPSRQQQQRGATTNRGGGPRSQTAAATSRRRAPPPAPPATSRRAPVTRSARAPRRSYTSARTTTRRY